ncbi:DnaD domain protein [Bacillus sp. FJAT-28004]|uniref:DnaD domain protein n=1 Tax=Bacillus sp. FJAT-28004 TaxID=1679165 RepID=UPI0006B45E72|nr:DnaD domain protein [Bacillus sp. FJAT-28004]
MAWIESHQELARHPKTKRLSRKLGVSVPAAIGHLHMLWWWAIDYAQDGNISDYDPEDIAEAVEWPIENADKLLQALEDAEFIDRVERCVTIHDWFDYAGRLVDNREKNKERKRKSRENAKKGKESHTDVTRDTTVTLGDGKSGHGATVPDLTLPNQTLPNQTQQNHTSTKKEQGEKSLAGGGIDPANNPFRLFETEGFGTISMVIADKLNFFIDDYGERWTCEAMKAAVVAGKRNLTYVKGILERYRTDGVDEPWNTVKKPTRAQSRSGKPQIEIVAEDRTKTAITDESLRELCDLARRADGLPKATEGDYLEFIRIARKE